MSKDAPQDGPSTSSCPPGDPNVQPVICEEPSDDKLSTCSEPILGNPTCDDIVSLKTNDLENRVVSPVGPQHKEEACKETCDEEPSEKHLISGCEEKKVSCEGPFPKLLGKLKIREEMMQAFGKEHSLVPVEELKAIGQELRRHPQLTRSVALKPTVETQEILSQIALKFDMHPEQLRFNALHLLPKRRLRQQAIPVVRPKRQIRAPKRIWEEQIIVRKKVNRPKLLAPKMPQVRAPKKIKVRPPKKAKKTREEQNLARRLRAARIPTSSVVKPIYRVLVPKNIKEAITRELLRYPHLVPSVVESPSEEIYKALTKIARLFELHPEKLRYNILHRRHETDIREWYLTLAKKVYNLPALWDAAHEDYQRANLSDQMWHSLDTELEVGIARLKHDFQLIKDIYFERWSLALEGQEAVEKSLTNIALFEHLERIFNAQPVEQTSDEERHKLAEKIYEHESIWNQSHPQYKNNWKRDAILTNIGTQLGLTIEEVKQRWAYLRDHFFRRDVQVKVMRIEYDDSTLQKSLYEMLEQMLNISIPTQQQATAESDHQAPTENPTEKSIETSQQKELSIGSSHPAAQQTEKKTSTAVDISILQLVESVFEHEILWNKNMTGSVEACKAAYEKVAEQLSVSVSFVEHKWNVLQQQFCTDYADYLHGVIFKFNVRLKDPVYQLLLKMQRMSDNVDVAETEELDNDKALKIAESANQNEILWKRDHPGFANWKERDDAFAGIAEQLGIPKNKVTQQWRIMRTAFNTDRTTLPQPVLSVLQQMDIGATHADWLESEEIHEQRLELTRLIYEREHIWNKQHHSYADKSKRDESYRVIATKLGIEVDDLKRRWASLRGLYYRMAQKPDSDKNPSKLFLELHQMLGVAYNRENYDASLKLAQLIHKERMIWTELRCPKEIRNSIYQSIAKKLGVTWLYVRLEWSRLVKMYKNRVKNPSASELSKGDPLFELMKEILGNEPAQSKVRPVISPETPLNPEQRSTLAEQIAKYDCLWSYTKSGYHEIFQRNQAWANVAAVVCIHQAKAEAEWLRALDRVREEQAALAAGIETEPVELDSLMLLADRVVSAEDEQPAPNCSSTISSKRPAIESIPGSSKRTCSW